MKNNDTNNAIEMTMVANSYRNAPVGERCRIAGSDTRARITTSSRSRPQCVHGLGGVHGWAWCWRASWLLPLTQATFAFFTDVPEYQYENNGTGQSGEG